MQCLPAQATFKRKHTMIVTKIFTVVPPPPHIHLPLGLVFPSLLSLSLATGLSSLSQAELDRSPSFPPPNKIAACKAWAVATFC